MFEIRTRGKRKQVCFDRIIDPSAHKCLAIYGYLSLYAGRVGLKIAYVIINASRIERRNERGFHVRNDGLDRYLLDSFGLG
jgi:hypothetical protein